MPSNVVKNYFDWNDSLRRYFFTESDASVKLLCVDDDILDLIGERYRIEKPSEISYHDHFRVSVALSNEGRTELLSFMRVQLRCNISLGRGTSLFHIAKRLSTIEFSNDIPDKYKLPFLALISLFILLSNDRDPKQSVIRSISALTGVEERVEAGGFDCIPSLLSVINKYDSAFDNNRRGARSNVGPLQYQKVLNQRELFLFKKLLFTFNIVFDQTITSYDELMNYQVLRIVKENNEFRPLYNRIVQNNSLFCEDYFTHQLQCFNREEFKAELSNRKDSAKIKGAFYLVIDYLLEPINRVSIYTDIPVAHTVQTDHGTISTPVGESINGLCPTNIRFESLEQYRSLASKDDELYDISFGSGLNGQIVLKEINDHLLVQTYSPLPGYSYYVIIQDKKAIERLQNQQHTDEVDFGDIWGGAWRSFLIRNWQIVNKESMVIKREPGIKVGPGIKVPGRHDVFFDKGLPSLLIPDNAKTITIERDLVGHKKTALKRVINQNSHNGHIYIDISTPANVSIDREDYPIRVKIGRTIIDSYSVFFSHMAFARLSPLTQLFTYDGWNRVSNSQADTHLSDNCLFCSEVFPYKTTNSTRNGVSTWVDKEKSFRFIELLGASYYLGGPLHNDTINEIIHYLAGFYNLPDVSNLREEYKYLIGVLVDLGFLNRSYDDKGCAIYQLASSRLFPVKDEGYGYQQFVLYGSFIENQVKAICGFNSSFSFVKTYDNREKERHSYLAFVPFYLTVSLNTCEIEKVRSSGIEIENSSLSDRILSIVKSPNAFVNDFLTKENRTANESINSDVKYPRVVFSYGRWRWEDGNSVYESYKPDNHLFRRVPIPVSLMKQYYRSLNNDPICLSNSEEGRIAFLDDMPIPDLFRKCLTYLNLGLATKRRVFGLDGFLGERIYYTMCEYGIRNEDQLIIANKLSGNDNPTILHYSLFNSRRYSLYYVKPNCAYEPFQLHLFFNFNSSKPLAYAKKCCDTYNVYYREGDVYYRLDYASPISALSAVIKDDKDLINHIDRGCTDDKIYNDSNAAEKEEIVILKKK